jgi:hypothetical protein
VGGKTMRKTWLIETVFEYCKQQEITLDEFFNSVREYYTDNTNICNKPYRGKKK